MPSPSKAAARSRGSAEKNRSHSPRVEGSLARLRELGLIDKRMTFGKRQAQRIVKDLEGVITGALKPVRVTPRTAGSLKGHVKEPTRARGVRRGVVLVDSEADVVIRKGGKGGGATPGIVRTGHGVIVPVDLGSGSVEAQAADLFRQLKPGEMVGFSLDAAAGDGRALASGGIAYTSRRLFRDPRDLAKYLAAYADVRSGLIGGVVVFGVGATRVPSYLAAAKGRADAARAAKAERNRKRRKARRGGKVVR